MEKNKKEKFRFFSWFKSEHKIKRWLLLAAISVVAICYAIASILVTDTLTIKEIIKIVILFVLGFSRSHIQLHFNAETDIRDNG